MLKNKLLWISGIYILLVFLFLWLSPKEIIWLDYFQKGKKDPYGSYIAYEELDELFAEVTVETKSLYNSVDSTSEIEGNYIFITDHFGLSEVEKNNLLDWVAEGNQVFIAANSIGQILLDTLNLTSKNLYFGFDELYTSDIRVGFKDSSTIGLSNEFNFKKQTQFRFFRDKFDSLPKAQSLSIIRSPDGKETNPVYVAQKFGKGTFFLHHIPYAFTNYYMLHENNHEYASLVLSYLPEKPTHWDEYYKPDHGEHKVALSLFLEQRGFKWAFGLGLFLVFIYMVFAMRRTQRSIPILKPPENRSLDFTSTIGDLYFSTKDHHDLLIKMEKHFKEYIYEKYFIQQFKGTTKEIEHLANKSGRTVGLINTIVTSFKSMKETEIKDPQLIRMSQKLSHFYYGIEK